MRIESSQARPIGHDILGVMPDRDELRARLDAVKDALDYVDHPDAPDDALVKALAAIRRLADLNEPLPEDAGWGG